MNPLALLAIALVVAVLVILLINALIGSNNKADTENKSESSQMTKEEKDAYEKAKKEKEWKDPNEHAKYVCDGGKVQCKYCSVPVSDIKVTSTTIRLQDKPWATIKDKEGVKNFNFTGQCLHPSQQKPSSPPPPCKSVINLGDWKDFSQTKIDDFNALVVQATIPCKISGEDLEIIDSGQKATLEQIEPSNKKKPKIIKMYWMDENKETKLEAIPEGQVGILCVQTKEFLPDETKISIPLKDKKGKLLETLEGNLDSKGWAYIKWTNKINQDESSSSI